MFFMATLPFKLFFVKIILDKKLAPSVGVDFNNSLYSVLLKLVRGPKQTMALLNGRAVETCVQSRSCFMKHF